METLSRITKLAKQFGIETTSYKNHLAQIEKEQKKISQQEREQAYVNQPREDVLKQYPELAPVFSVQDKALGFYQEILEYHENPATLQRNLLRAQSCGLEALQHLNKGEHIRGSRPEPSKFPDSF